MPAVAPALAGRFAAAVNAAVNAAVAAAVRGCTDAQLERRFGSRATEQALLRAMASSFDPAGADGWEGELCYVLSCPATSGRERWLTIEVRGGRARVRRGGGPDAKVTLRLQVSDFVRIAAGEIEAATPLVNGRGGIDGDLLFAMRIPRMFGPALSARPAPG